MSWFAPYKRHPKQFEYNPRYYDPVKEARDERRRMMKGMTIEEEMASDHKPGDYIRAAREARLRRKDNSGRRKGSNSTVITLGFVALIILFAAIIYPRLVSTFRTAQTAHKSTQLERETEEFNPYQPITIVPNDYKEE